MSHALEQYFRSQQVPLQWSPILRALSEQFNQTAGDDTSLLRDLFRGVGRRFAQSVVDQYAGCGSLADLTDAFNGLWSELNWGMVEMVEQADLVSINHYYAPLAEAFGGDSLCWSVGLLEGFYQASFQQLGAGEEFGVQFVAQADDGMSLNFRFATQKQLSPMATQ